MNRPRIALLGIMLESNAFAPVATRDDFHRHYYREGEALLEEARAPVSAIPTEMAAFVQAMDVTGPWEPVPLLFANTPPWGPADWTFIAGCLDRIEAMLADAGPVDGVYIANHGAMTSTETLDPDGEIVARMRACAGNGVPVIVTHDLHANLSERLVEACDMLIGYTTNPHVDMRDRGEEAAFAMRRMLAGMRPKSAFIRLPLTPPSVTLLTAAGPYADMIDHGQRRMRESGGEIINVTILGGFVFADTPKNGVSIVVTARSDEAAARALAREIAEYGWSIRERFRRELMPVEAAAALALETAADPALPAVIFSDAGDNPGGGGEGRTTWLLRALVAAGARGVFYGSFFDPELAEEAHRAGEGARIEAVFNRDRETEFSKELRVPAEVLKVTDGRFVGRLGIYRGRQVDLGPSAALRIGGPEGIVVIVIGARQQTADPMFFESFGLDIAAARVVCVKSRGHFRAGFLPWFSPSQVFEVDTAGLTSPVLDRFRWRHLPRPVYPLDAVTEWAPPDW
ncbi:MAG: M81 family metallopeptidase [Alphaproteobacteria bacterium]|nr:M81 family metallopeptidase [Alphaproteobacteria bacterium]